MKVRLDSLTFGHKVYDLDDIRSDCYPDTITGCYSIEAFLVDLEMLLRFDPVRVYEVVE